MEESRSPQPGRSRSPTRRTCPVIDYRTITDDTGVLTVAAPVEWADTDTAPLTLDRPPRLGSGGSSVIKPRRRGSRRRRRSPISTVANRNTGADLHGPATPIISRRHPCRVRPPSGACTDGPGSRTTTTTSTRVVSDVHRLRRHDRLVHHGRSGAIRQLVHGRRGDAGRLRRRSGSTRPGSRNVQRDACNFIVTAVAARVTGPGGVAFGLISPCGDALRPAEPPRPHGSVSG